MPGKIIINYDAEVVVTRGQTNTYADLRSSYNSHFYDLAIVAQEIVRQEAEFCNFETVGFMQLYPEFKIQRFRTGQGDTVYTITHKSSQEVFRFAVRACVIPPAF